ncbi:peptidoglycan -binding protein [Pseudodonghicola sp.]|uniref:peptidoglycan -binding protein n=1 Tax=Pseudodonghicola sp. TaxID=1969463 RepID=UPI003A982661
MALSRRGSQHSNSPIWPGFVDAMTGLLMVLMFVLTIFMVVQFVLRETITGQESELDKLSAEVATLAQSLGLQERTNAQLKARMGALTSTLNDTQSNLDQAQAALAALTAERDQKVAALDAAQGRIASFEEQVAGLLADKTRVEGQVAALEGEKAKLISEQEALNLALAKHREEIDAQAEAARLDAAKREALEALVADLRKKDAEGATQMGALQSQLSEAEKARLAETAAAEALRDKLKNSDAELTAMTLELERQRKAAEDTLTLLAAADAAKKELDQKLAAALADLDASKGASTDPEELRRQLTAALAAKAAAEVQASDQLSEAEQRQILLAKAREQLAKEQEISAEAQRQTALLNQQVAALRGQLGSLQALLDDYKERDSSQQVRLDSLGKDLNAALARAASEERKRRVLEEAERKRLEVEAAKLKEQTKDLERYRSEFFGRLRDVLGTQEGVHIQGDRFVFSSEVLFPTGEAELSDAGKAELSKIARILRGIAAEIPPEIDWVIRVDGHTDNVPLRPGAIFKDNWELSQARALSVVRYLVDQEGIPPGRLSANGFGEYQPINPANTPEARAQNRRIELKLTEK